MAARLGVPVEEGDDKLSPSDLSSTMVARA